MFSRILTIMLLTGLAVIPVFAQDVHVKGRFESDSVRIGEPIPYSLTVRYPSGLHVLLPDTTFSFAPFELQHKLCFPTVTRNNVSYDSVVYFLATYEIDAKQTLHLPAFVVHPGDCTVVNSNTDTTMLKQLVHVKLDSLSVEQLPLKVNTDYLSVAWLLNYPLLLIIGGILIVVLIAGWLIFGKRITRYYKLKRMVKKHAAFLQQYATSVQRLQENFSSAEAESIFVLWKKYMENLVARPYTRYTSREILTVENDETLGQALRALNRIIYAGINPASEEAFVQLRNYTEAQFVKKTSELTHG